MEKIEFELFGLSLLEPLSTIMNWLLAAQCFVFFRKLSKQEVKTNFLRFWIWFFLAYTVSLTFGGASHLFYNYLGLPGKIPGWSLSLLGAMMGEFAMIQDIQDPKKKNILIQVIRSLFFASAVMLILDFSFKWVMLQTAGLFLFVIIISINRYRKGIQSYRYFFYGIGCLLLMGPVKVAGLDIHPAWFNRDDIAHILMFIAYWMFYKAIVRVNQQVSFYQG